MYTHDNTHDLSGSTGGFFIYPLQLHKTYDNISESMSEI